MNMKLILLASAAILIVGCQQLCNSVPIPGVCAAPTATPTDTPTVTPTPAVATISPTPTINPTATAGPTAAPVGNSR
jgi:hypothetical protein